MLIRSEIPSDRNFPAITDSVVSAKGTTPPHNYFPNTQIRVLTIESVAPRKNEPKVSVHPQETIMPRSCNAGCNPRTMSKVCVHTNVHCLHIAHRLRYDGPMYHIPFHTFIPYFEDGKSINNTIFRKKTRSGTKSDRYT